MRRWTEIEDESRVVETVPAPAEAGHGGRALVWDATNTAALLAARALRRRGWTVDWMGGSASPWKSSQAFDGERTSLSLSSADDAERLRVLSHHPLDALVLCGDDQVRWMLLRRVPNGTDSPLSLHVPWQWVRRIVGFLPQPDHSS